MRQFAGTLLAATLVALGACGTAWGDVFLLANGGRMEGELLNPDQVPRQTYAVRTAAGIQITLAPDQVKEVIHRRPEEVEYDAIRHGYPDTVAAQWELAEWCRQRQLLSEREARLRRILELDTDHEQARRALGYSRVGGQWMTQEERMTADGYRRYKGRWRTQQEIDLMANDRQKKTAEGAWKQKLNLWREWLGSAKHRQAQESIEAIDDPDAVKALAYVLKEDGRDQARLLYIDALARIDTSGARRILAIGATNDPVEEVRLTCLDHLKKKQDPESVAYFISGLKSDDNAQINLAARALRQMGDPAAVGALIDAVVTVHKYKVTTGSPGQTSATFGNSGASGLSTGSTTTIQSKSLNNRDVLDALVALTGGVNFGYDVGRWKAWYASEKTRRDLDARRD